MSYYITLGDKTTAELGIVILKENTVITGLPDTRDFYTDAPGKHGSYDFGADLMPRAFMINCDFSAAITPEQIEAAIEALNAHLLDNWGRPVTMNLELSWKPGKVYQARYAGRQEVDASVAMARRRFLLPMVAFDPLAYGPQQQEIEAITLSPTTLQYTVDSGLNVPVTIIIDNNGGSAINGFTFKTFEDILEWTSS